MAAASKAREEAAARRTARVEEISRKARGYLKSEKEELLEKAGVTAGRVEEKIKSKARKAQIALQVQRVRDPMGPYRPEGMMGPIDYQEMTNVLDPLPTGKPNQALKIFSEQEQGIGGIGRVSRYQREPTMNPTNSVPLSCGAVGGCGWD